MAARRGGHLYLDQTTPPRDCCPLQKVPLPKLDDLKWIAENIDNIDRYSIYIYAQWTITVSNGLWFNPGDPSNAAEMPKATIRLMSHAL